MFSKLFQKSTQADGTAQSMASSDFAPRVVVHYGIPSTASIIGFDPIQRLLAVGTLDGRIKVIGGDNIEGLLTSPKALPFKSLEFLQNQGFLVSVSNDNEIQVWDLEKRCISSSVQWESNITAFSVIPGTNYMYLGDEFGFLSVLKYNTEESNILQLPYNVPPNLIAEVAGISLPDQLSIVGVLSQPCSCGNRVLIAFQNGLLILWDVTEETVVHVQGYNDLHLKEGTVVNFTNGECHSVQNDSLENEQAEKEISSLCWVSPDGSVLAVGYVDGDILLWNLSVPDTGNGQRTENAHDDVVKIQISSVDSRLPVIVLHWSSNNSHSCRGQLFAYGGEGIESEEVLTILDLDWSSGLSKLKCIERVNLRLHGSFADVLVMSNAHNAKNNNAVFVLTNPGQLHFYEYASVSTLKSEKGKSHSVHASQYHSVIPTLEPYMTVGKLYVMGSERNIPTALSKTVSTGKQQLDDICAGESIRWPMTGGVPHQKSTTESAVIERIYIGGYQDGSARIWDATFPVLSLVSLLKFELKGVQVAGAEASISAIDLCSANSVLAIGNESGVIFLYRLQGNSNQTNVTVVTETTSEVHSYPLEDKTHCSVIYSIVNSPVRALQFETSGARLVAGFECGQVAVLDTTTPSILYIKECVSSSGSPCLSLAVKTSSDSHDSSSDNSDLGTESVYGMEIVFALTLDANLVLMDSSSGNTISSQPICPDEKSIAISMHLLEDKHFLAQGPSPTIDAQDCCQNQSVLPKAEEATVPKSLERKQLPLQILLCCEDSLYLYHLKSLLQGDNSLAHKQKLEKPCSWTSVFEHDAEKYGLIIVYQNGDIEIRSLPELKLLGNTSMTSIVRWNYKNNMDKTMSASVKGQITLVYGCEFAFVSLLASENEFRVPECLPCLHDKALAAAADAVVNYGENLRKSQNHVPGFISNMIKGLKGPNEEEQNFRETRATAAAHLEKIFSRSPFSTSFNLDDIDLEIDGIDIDEPIHVDIDEPVHLVINEPVPVLSPPKSKNDSKDKENERSKLLEGGSSDDSKPKLRTREEIIAKYRGPESAAAAAAEARNKLIERQEKLEKLSKNSEELQSDAQNFAELARELAKNMEQRKWWQF